MKNNACLKGKWVALKWWKGTSQRFLTEYIVMDDTDIEEDDWELRIGSGAVLGVDCKGRLWFGYAVNSEYCDWIEINDKALELISRYSGKIMERESGCE